MNNLFEPAQTASRSSTASQKLQAGATRQWGKMDAAQMCAHCAAAMEVAAGDVDEEPGVHREGRSPRS